MTELTELIQQEHQAIQQSRAKRLPPAAPNSTVDPASLKAICLSGGGVRSATFATGIFNSWAKDDGAILRKFDYLSTVSGGGYFGAFYGRMFQNDELKNQDAIYNALSSPHSKHIRYLKRSGRYLANSGDEGIFAAATLIRNLLWLHFLLALALFPAFALLHYFQSADLFGHLSFARPSQLWWDIPLIYWGTLVIAIFFFITVALYFALAGKVNPQSLRKLTRVQSWLLRGFAGTLAAALLISATQWLIAKETLNSDFDDVWQYFAGLYAAIATFSASIYRIQAKIQQVIGVTIKAKAFVFILAICALVIYLLSASAMTLFALSLLHAHPLLHDPHCGFELSLLIIGFFSLLIGVFLSSLTESINHSSLHYFYAARLRRSFLGAANAKRFSGQDNIDKGATEYDDSDDVLNLTKYTTYKNGGPLHLINVTLNSSRSPDGNLWWPDCKGFNLAFSALGFNYEHNRYALWKNDQGNRDEIPNLGTSIAISGAAASTGMGQLSSVAGGILTALFNIRTGYWWHYKTQMNYFYRLYSAELVNAFNVKELSTPKANKPRPKSHWYLSDGGHFENLAVYEMIRRRVPRIVAIDCGCDANFQFEDLTNLIRRARLDFQCELQVATVAQLATVIETQELHACFGSLDDLKPETSEPLWQQPAPNTKRAVLFKGTFFAEAEDHNSGINELWLLYIKPTVTRQEPADLLRYQIENPDFPHQSTADQFFDEAQWESYRKLGEITANDLKAAVTEFLG